jgi:hypothetical protein
VEGDAPLWIADYQTVWDLAEAAPTDDEPGDAPPEPPDRYLVGTVYRDANGNGRFDYGEGVSGIEIGVFDGGQWIVGSTSDMAGGFALPIKDGEYRLEFRLPGSETPMVRNVDLFGKNSMLDVAVTASDLPPAGLAAAR